MILLPQQTVHLWLTDRRTLTPALSQQYPDWLSSDEQAALEHSHNPERQQQQLYSRAMVRWCLSQYSDSLKPADWDIQRDPKGKPHLHNSHLPLRFSLSHSGDWLALAITTDTAIGVDIEHHRRTSDWRAVAQRYFAADEVTALEQTPEAHQRERFFELWTLKEAYFKARGIGIATGLDKVRFALDNNGAIRASFADSLTEDASQWQFHHYQLGSEYCLSLALQQPPAQDAEVHVYKAIPAQEYISLNLEAHRIIPH